MKTAGYVVVLSLVAGCGGSGQGSGGEVSIVDQLVSSPMSYTWRQSTNIPGRPDIASDGRRRIVATWSDRDELTVTRGYSFQYDILGSNAGSRGDEMCYTQIRQAWEQIEGFGVNERLKGTNTVLEDTCNYDAVGSEYAMAIARVEMIGKPSGTVFAYWNPLETEDLTQDAPQWPWLAGGSATVSGYENCAASEVEPGMGWCPAWCDSIISSDGMYGLPKCQNIPAHTPSTFGG